jgi:hypothetical protein
MRKRLKFLKRVKIFLSLILITMPLIGGYLYVNEFYFTYALVGLFVLSQCALTWPILFLKIARLEREINFYDDSNPPPGRRAQPALFLLKPKTPARVFFRTNKRTSPKLATCRFAHSPSLRIRNNWTKRFYLFAHWGARLAFFNPYLRRSFILGSRFK